MPSTFRASRSGRHLDNANRSRTGQIDHDVFEGLPVRRWSRQPHIVSQAPKGEDSELGESSGGTTALPELPMPRDSQLLPAMSRALLRAARAGCIYIRPSGRAIEKEKEEGTDGEEQGATVHLSDRSFTSRKWAALPKHMEPAEVEFLAKRRPGLPSLYGNGADGGAAPGPMRKTKIQRTDPETGNISVYEVWVPEGHRIEGEITGDVQTLAEQSAVPVTAETPAPGTVVDGVGVVNAEGVVVAEAGSAAVMTPPKRRPPPPKRKGRGIGKGRKKKVMFAPGEGADAAIVHGVAPAAGAVASATEGEDASRMSVDQSGADDDEEDGEDGDESDEGDESMMEGKTPETPQAPPSTDPADQAAADVSAEQPKDVVMADALLDVHPLVSEEVIRQEHAQQPQTTTPAVPTEAPQAVDEDTAPIPASMPSLAPEGTEAPGEQLDQRTSIELPAPVTPAVQATIEPTPEQEQLSVAIEENSIQEPSDIPPTNVKSETTPQAEEDSMPPPVAGSFEEPEEKSSKPLEQSEQEQPAGEAPVAQPEVVSEQSTQAPPPEELKTEAQPVSESIVTETSQSPTAPDTAIAPAEVKGDVEMGEAPLPEEPKVDQPPIKASSPSPVESIETKPEAQPEANVDQTAASLELESVAPEFSKPAISETASVAETQSEEPLAPKPTPTLETTAAESQAAPASEATPTAEPDSVAQALEEAKKDETDPVIAPAPESS